MTVSVFSLPTESPAALRHGGRTTRTANGLATMAPAAAPALLDVLAVATMLGCSQRHVYRLSDAGRMPRPVKLGALVRWNRADLDAWVADGCPSCRQAKGGVR